MSLSASVGSLAGVGPKRSDALEEAGVATVLDLLMRLPKGYVDHRSPQSLTPTALQAAVGRGLLTFVGELHDVRRVFTRRRGLRLTQGRLVGADGELRCVWFNRHHLEKAVAGGGEFRLAGALRNGRRGIELLNPEVSTSQDEPKVTPLYPALAGIGPKLRRSLTACALELAGDIDPLPSWLLERHGLPGLSDSLRYLHAPPADVDVAALVAGSTSAHERLIYGEVLALQLELAQAAASSENRAKPHTVEVNDAIRSVVRECLPFRLTEAQRRTSREVVDDLRADAPMLRLLQGDVGCGKTVVAAIAALVVAENGLQSAFLAPTEVLAEQLADTLDSMIGGRHSVSLLTGTSAGAEATRRAVAAGDALIVVGTHALLEENTAFASLSLVVIDEQHRFGVAQRATMMEKGVAPDVLLMSATPIPRSLALTIFGDLELSTIDELPPGRRPIPTELLSVESRDAVLDRLRAVVARGERAFVVFPRIDDDGETAASITGHGTWYAQNLPGLTGFLTGRTDANERARILRAFAEGHRPILVATTVVEVGVDVPLASMMVIEGAERFGLAQLHQLRGRVGRSAQTAENAGCIAVHAADCAEESIARLTAFAETLDGFELARLDLEQRGPGSLLGLRQTGFADWTPQRLARATHWLEAARQDAVELLASDPAGLGEARA